MDKLHRCDVAVVGGGIAGGALAAILAREGLAVALLERRRRYDDQVRGESLWPWGVAEAEHLGLAGVLLEGAGGRYVEALVDYGDGDDPRGAETDPIPMSQVMEGVPGALNVSHPAACDALVTLAESAGSRLFRGALHIEVVPGPRPTVRFVRDGVPHELACRLVVGADGRSSRVRAGARIELRRATHTHMIAGLLVDGLDVDPGRDLAAVGEDAFIVVFPQGDGRARVYLCPGIEDAQRFAGPEGGQRFLRTCAAIARPHADAWRHAVAAGPCRTYPGDDTWTDRPFADGVVLVGDAGGHNNPLIGQGLALALRDVRALREVLLAPRWDTDAFAHYGTERAERLRRMRFVAQLLATELTTFGRQGRGLRRRIRERLNSDSALLAAPFAMFTGPDSLEPEVCTAQFRRRYLGDDA